MQKHRRPLRTDTRKGIKEEPTRSIAPEVTLELWTRSAGRCEFRGCNKILYKSGVTQRRGNFAERAHIWSFSKDGPRGRGHLRNKTKALNSAHNLMLMCPTCHKEIDADKQGKRFSAVRLQEWKKAHEDRVTRITGINPKRSSRVIVYTAKIDQREISIDEELAHNAMFPERYPHEEHPIDLSNNSQLGDRNGVYWEAENANLRAAFATRVQPLIDGRRAPHHYSLFGFAPIPLLILLGSLFSNKVRSDVYQLHRESEDWAWPKQGNQPSSTIDIIPPSRRNGDPAIVLSLSDAVALPLVGVQGDFRVWHMRARTPGFSLIRRRTQVADFAAQVREIVSKIGAVCGKSTPIHIFPALPISCAIALGRSRMDKIDGPWIIYDYHTANKGFSRAFTIGGTT